MAKKVIGQFKLHIPAGKATPAPPVGPALGQHGVNIMDFCKAFNARTQEQSGTIIPVVITVYADSSYTFVTKTPPAAVLLKKAAGLEKASGEPNRNKVGTGNPGSGRGDREDQDARPQRQHPRGGSSDHRGQRESHGDRRRRLREDRMPKHGKKYAAAAQTVEDQLHGLAEAVVAVRKAAFAKFAPG